MVSGGVGWRRSEYIRPFSGTTGILISRQQGSATNVKSEAQSQFPTYFRNGNNGRYKPNL
jgi:hypothetical protein